MSGELFMNAAAVNRGNAARVASAFEQNDSPTPLADGNFLSDLDSLRSAIESASHDTVIDPHSECRKSMELLAGLAAYHGPMGDAAREELRDLYLNPPGHMAGEVRDQLLNSALEVCLRCEGESLSELAPTVLIMAKNAPESPVGKNGEGPRTILRQALERKLRHAWGAQPLAQDRSAIDMAASARFKNLDWSQPASVATPEAARHSFDRVLSEVANQQKTLTIWVADAEGHCIPVVAQPTSSGGVRFHVIAQDAAGNEVGKHLTELAEDDCVIVHNVEDAHIALKHLDANFNDERGPGAVLREHADQWPVMSAEDRKAAKLMSQAEKSEALAEMLDNPKPPDIMVKMSDAVQSARRANALEQPPAPIPFRLQTPTQKLAAQNLRIVANPGTDGSGDPRISLQIESPMTRLAVAINAMDTMSDPRPRIRAEGQRKFDDAIRQLQSQGVDAAYVRRIHANIHLFKEIDKKSWLASTGPEPLRRAASALTATATQAAFTQFVTRRTMPLDAAYAEIAKGEGTRPNALKGAVEELTTTENVFFANIDNAISELKAVIQATPEDLRTWKKAGVTDKQATQIKQDAKAIIDALRELQDLATDQVFKEYKETFYDSTDESLRALTDTIRALAPPAPPTPEAFSANAAAAGFGSKLHSDSELGKAMAALAAIEQKKPSARSVFGRTFDKAPFASFGSPKDLEDLLEQAVNAAQAVENAPNKPTAIRAFNARLAAVDRYVNRHLDEIDANIQRLDDIQKSSAGQHVKADAGEMREALFKLRTKWGSGEGLPQKIGKFCRLGALYPQEAQAALLAVSAGAQAAD